MTTVDDFGSRLAQADLTLSGAELLVAVLIGAALVGAPGLWRLARLLVTLVHELGHAFVGVLVGRRFNGFVLRGDMSGHAITYGPATGLGRVVTTWAGYPAPAVLAGILVFLAAHGLAAGTLAVLFLLLVVALVRVRSPLTALVTVAVLAGTGALWWWRADVLQAQLLLAVGLLLLVGCWRHLGAVLLDRSTTSDPGVLGRITPVPAVLWQASFVLVAAAATCWVVQQALAIGTLG